MNNTVSAIAKVGDEFREEYNDGLPYLCFGCYMPKLIGHSYCLECHLEDMYKNRCCVCGQGVMEENKVARLEEYGGDTICTACFSNSNNKFCNICSEHLITTDFDQCPNCQTSKCSTCDAFDEVVETDDEPEFFRRCKTCVVNVKNQRREANNHAFTACKEEFDKYVSFENEYAKASGNDRIIQTYMRPFFRPTTNPTAVLIDLAVDMGCDRLGPIFLGDNRLERCMSALQRLTRA